ncbi:MAG: radical SAM protein [Candidatus Orphnella occulta]|nr:radical SAM protein [Candidatus Orphnella occulta]
MIAKDFKNDIVLVLPPPGWQKTLPIGLGFCAAYLKKNEFSSVIYDVSVEMGKVVQKDDYDYLWGLKAKNIWLDNAIFDMFVKKYDNAIQGCVDHMLSFKSQIIGFSVIHPKQLITLELIRRIKNRDSSITIIAGGPACFYDEDRRMLEQSRIIDLFVLGEGEKTLCEVINCIKTNKKLDNVAGIRCVNSDYKDYLPREAIEDLDCLPFPVYPGLDFDDYRANPVPLFWSRGCFGNCSFCEIKNVWNSYRIRSAENIYEEIKFYVEQKGAVCFSVFDSLMNGRPEILEKVCDYIIQHRYKISWNGNIVSLPQMSERIYSKMKMAGCEVVYFGLETGSDHILRKMKKPFTLREAQRNIRLAHEAGIETSVNFITGFPGEGECHFQQTIDFVRLNSFWIDKVDFITECQVARGTDLFNHPDRYEIIVPHDWQGYKWYTRRGDNTIRMRQERTARLGKFLKLSDIQINTDFNLEDGSECIRDSVKNKLK